MAYAVTAVHSLTAFCNYIFSVSKLLVGRQKGI